MPADTGGFSKLGGKVITRISARRLTVSDSPNGVQSRPNFAKSLGFMCKTRTHSGQVCNFKKKIQI